MSDRARNRESAYPHQVPGIIERWSRTAFLLAGAGMVAGTAALMLLTPWAGLLLIPVGAFVAVGFADIIQRRHTLRRNFPVIGHLRYIFESLRPELRQYFVESDSEENPISREKRSIVYQRAKGQLDTLAFGTRRDVYGSGYEWMNHSLAARSPRTDEVRIPIGEGTATEPYHASIFNISAMSFGALSSRAILALNRGARLGGFSHNTGEGGLSSYHLEPEGDIVWQIGTGYFGARTCDGEFSPEAFAENARRESVRMIEIKLSQGAKPGHGGILPGAKVTPEIATIRGVPPGRDVVSPPAHTAFSSPVGMMRFIERLRQLSGGKPVGIKLCVGNRRDVFALCKAMLETDIQPDFITVDGGEGGTGAAPLEFSNSVGAPLNDGLTFVHQALVGSGLRERIRIIASGKITTGFHIVSKLALGADLCNSARGMMFALGCIQATKCNTNHCPVGIATQDPRLSAGLDVEDKAERVRSFHAHTVESVFELLGAAGLDHPGQVRPEHILRRVDVSDVRTYGEIYPTLEPGAMLTGSAPETLMRLWDAARTDSFG
jgi:glutamate synthase domain-containing protein 2